jgi:hypothetical protein
MANWLINEIPGDLNRDSVINVLSGMSMGFPFGTISRVPIDIHCDVIDWNFRVSKQPLSYKCIRIGS